MRFSIHRNATVIRDEYGNTIAVIWNRKFEHDPVCGVHQNEEDSFQLCVEAAIAAGQDHGETEG